MEQLQTNIDYVTQTLNRLKRKINALIQQINDNEDVNEINRRLTVISNDLSELKTTVERQADRIEEVNSKLQESFKELIKDVGTAVNQLDEKFTHELERVRVTFVQLKEVLDDIAKIRGCEDETSNDLNVCYDYGEIGKMLQKLMNDGLVEKLLTMNDTGRIGIKEVSLWKRLVNEYVSLVSNMGVKNFGRLERTVREQRISMEYKGTDGKINLQFQDFASLCFSINSLDASVLMNGENLTGDNIKTNRMSFGIKIEKLEPIIFNVEVDFTGIYVVPDAHDLTGRMLLGTGKEKIQYYTFQVSLFRQWSDEDAGPVISLDLTAWTYDYDENSKSCIVPKTPRVARYQFPIVADWVNSNIKIVTYDKMATDLVYFSVICPNINVSYTNPQVKQTIINDQIFYPIYDAQVISHIKLTMLRFGIIYLSEKAMDGKVKKIVHKFEDIDTTMNYMKQYQLAFTAYVNDIISRTAVYGECTISGVNKETKTDNYLTITCSFADEIKRSENIDISVCNTEAFHPSYPDPPKLSIKSTAITSENRTSLSLSVNDKWSNLLYNDLKYGNKFIYEVIYANDNGQAFSATLIGGVQMTYKKKDPTKLGFDWEVAKVYLESFYKNKNAANYRYGWIEINSGRHDSMLKGSIQYEKPEATFWAYIFDPGWVLPLSSTNTMEMIVELKDGYIITLKNWSPREWIFEDGLRTYGLFCEIAIDDSEFFFTNNEMSLKLDFQGFSTESPSRFRLEYFGAYNRRVTKKCPTLSGQFIYDVNVVNDYTNQNLRMDCDTRCLLQLDVDDHTLSVVKFDVEDGNAMTNDTVLLTRGQSWCMKNKPKQIIIKGKFTSPSKPTQLVGLTDWNEITESNRYMISNLVVYTQFINKRVDAVEIRVKSLMQMLNRVNGPMQKWSSLLNIAAIVTFPINPMVGTVFMFTGSLLQLADEGLNATSILNVMGNALSFHIMLMHTIRMSKFMNERYKIKLGIDDDHVTTQKEALDFNDDADDIVIFDRSKIDVVETIPKALWDKSDDELDTTDYRKKLLLDPGNSIENETRLWWNTKKSMNKVRKWLAEKTGKWANNTIEDVNKIAYEMKEFNNNPYGIVERIAVPLEDHRIRPLGVAYETIRVAETTFGNAKEGFGIQKVLQELNVTPEHSYLRATWIDTEKQPITDKFNGKVTKYTLLYGVADFQKAESIASRNVAGSSNMANEAGKFIIAERRTYNDGGLWNSEYDFSKSYMTQEQVEGIWNQQLINMDALKADPDALSKTTLERKYQILCNIFEERYNNRKGMRVINKPAPISNVLAREFMLKRMDKIGLNYNLLFNNCQHFSQAMFDFMTRGYIPEYIKNDSIMLQELQDFRYEYDKSIDDILKFNETGV